MNDAKEMTRQELEEAYELMVRTVHKLAGPAMAYQQFKLEYLKILWSKSRS